MEDHRLLELEFAIKDLKWDIIGLSEVRRSGEEIREYNDFIFYYKGEKQGRYGVGFIVKKYLKDKIVSFEGISDRLIALNVKLSPSKPPLTIIQAYAPSEQDTKIEKEKFYNKLTEVAQRMNKNLVVVGDFNAKVGNHRMVRGAMIVDNRSSRKHIMPNKNITLQPIPHNALNDLKKSLMNLEIHETVQSKYDFLENSLIGVNKLRTKKDNNNKLGNETIKLMEERNKMLDNRKENRKDIANISKRIQTSIRRHRKEERIKVLREQIEKTGGTKKGLKQLKEYTLWIPKVKTKPKNYKSRLTVRRSSIEKTATEFYKQLYTETDKTTNTEEKKKDVIEEDIPHILEAEVLRAIRTQKSGKASGEDKISNELLKDTIASIITPLTDLFNEILANEQIPTQWTKSTITLLYKKGDKRDINNYRPISLMSNLYKVFSKCEVRRDRWKPSNVRPEDEPQMDL
ncbi:PREDICTED: uncharacterized protein LOC106110415 [Papilio polytes]|uniref:uncharacterized protein LOC106110415 n=1 Tax=Papilio polytes TaxID=76194 RepID=UPI000675C393|nr:PREDICTED: uncharacterized protein LOC106110415 [Papilio polytes]